MKKIALCFLLPVLCGHYVSFSQCRARVSHAGGDSLVDCIKVNVSSQGTVDLNPDGCPETGPYNVGYNLSSMKSANGSYTFTFTPAVSSLTLNFSGVSFLDWGKELIRLYVNGQHYVIPAAGSKTSCDDLAVLTTEGDITGCYPCGTSAWNGTVITGSISTLTVLDSCAWGYGNGSKFSLDICGNPIHYASLGNDTTLCEGQTLLLDITTPNSTYQWQDGSVNPTFLVKKKGIYWVAVKNDCGEKKDSINVDYIPAAFSLPGNDTTLCFGDSLLLSASLPSSSYLWQDNSTNPELLVNHAGIYWVKVSNKCGIKTDSVTINYFPLQTFNLGNDTTLCKGSTLLLNATTPNSTYIWQDNSTQPVFTVAEPGTYQVKIKNTCVVTSNKLSISYHSCNCFIYMPGAFTPNLDGRNDNFPPAFDCNFSEYSLKIFNRWGQQVFQANSNANKWDGTYKGSPQPIGTYVYIFMYKVEAGKSKTTYGQVTLLR